FTVEGPPAEAPSWSTSTLRMLPSAARYWKMPCCAVGLRTEALAEMLCGWIDCAYVPKKNSLFFRIGPPTLNPKSFSLTILRGRLRALLDQEFAFSEVFWKSSKTRPWYALLPLRVTSAIFIADVPFPLRSNCAV